jgi:hypothetical protein
MPKYLIEVPHWGDKVSASEKQKNFGPQALILLHMLTGVVATVTTKPG